LLNPIPPAIPHIFYYNIFLNESEALCNEWFFSFYK
jgi:hypothetical protein